MTPSYGHVLGSSRLSRRALLAVGGAAAVARVAPVRAGPRHGFADVQSWIERQVDAGRIVGAAVSIARDGVILWESGFGFADIASRARATPITPFGLASITKPFVTAALAASASAGRIDLDGPVEQALPFRLPVSAFSADGVTARRLGSHCSGLPSFFRLAAVSGRPPVMEALIEEFGRIAYPPGAVYEYSNLGFALLGEALSHIEGASFEAAMHRRIIRPMGLRDSFFLSERSGRTRPATRYDAERRPITDYTTATPASGELCASANDLSIFAAHLMGAQKGRERVFAPSTLQSIFAPVFRAGDGRHATFGWMGFRAAGEQVFMKSGGDPGVSTRLILLPERRVSISPRRPTGSRRSSSIDGRGGARISLRRSPIHAVLLGSRASGRERCRTADVSAPSNLRSGASDPTSASEPGPRWSWRSAGQPTAS